MKTFLLTVSILFCYLISLGQNGYEVGNDPKHPEVKVLKGVINKYLLINDTSFKWYKTNQAGYLPDTAVLSAFVKEKKNLQFVLFGGTWCDDSQFILPRFFKIQELSEVSEEQISFFGVDRDKKTIGNIAQAFGVTNVPTIIVMKDGKELGRVVEYGKTGKWDEELGAIIRGL